MSYHTEKFDKSRGYFDQDTKDPQVKESSLREQLKKRGTPQEKAIIEKLESKEREEAERKERLRVINRK